MGVEVWLKLLAIVLIFAICFIGGVVPIRLLRYFPEGKTISYANCLSAGILIGAALVHLLNDAEEEAFAYPFAHLCCGVGFFGAFILDKIAFTHGHNHAINENTASERLVQARTPDSPRLVALDDLRARINVSVEPASGSQEVPPVPWKHSGSLENPDHAHTHAHAHDGPHTGHAQGHIPSQTNTHAHAHAHAQEHSHTEEAEAARTAYILFSVLGLESFISGSALGITGTSVGVMVIGIAIITHTWAEAFALCTSFLKAGMSNRRIYKLVAVFSVITPLGILAGMVLQSILQGYVAKVVSGMLIAFAAGTFLYVATLEIIAEEFETPHNKFAKLNLLLIGFAFMSAIAVWI